MLRVRWLTTVVVNANVAVGIVVIYIDIVFVVVIETTAIVNNISAGIIYSKRRHQRCCGCR